MSRFETGRNTILIFFFFFTLQNDKRSTNTILTMQRNTLPRSLRNHRDSTKNSMKIRIVIPTKKKKRWRNFDRFLRTLFITYRWWRDVPWWQTVLSLLWVYAWYGTDTSCIRPRARHRECEAHRTAAPGISHLFSVCHRVDTGSKKHTDYFVSALIRPQAQLSNQG